MWRKCALKCTDVRYAVRKVYYFWHAKKGGPSVRPLPSCVPCVCDTIITLHHPFSLSYLESFQSFNLLLLLLLLVLFLLGRSERNPRTRNITYFRRTVHYYCTSWTGHSTSRELEWRPKKKLDKFSYVFSPS